MTDIKISNQTEKINPVQKQQLVRAYFVCIANFNLFPFSSIFQMAIISWIPLR